MVEESYFKHPIFKEPEINNPYIDGAKLLYTRLKWDLHPESWRSRRRMKQLKDAYKGQKAVILCNGPSLKNVDLNSLKGIYTFGLNQLHSIFGDMDFRPSCMVIADLLAAEKAKEFLISTDIPLFLSHKSIGSIPSRSNITYMHEARTRKFSRDLSMSFYGGFTVTFVAMQLAYHMGFDQVALIGCDHNYYTKGEERFKPLKIDKDREKYYFSNKYNQDLVQIYPASFNDVEHSYGMARDFFEAYGRGIYNCTEGGRLEVFPRMSLDDFLVA